MDPISLNIYLCTFSLRVDSLCLVSFSFSLVNFGGFIAFHFVELLAKSDTIDAVWETSIEII